MPANGPILLKLLVIDDVAEEATVYGWYLHKVKKYHVRIDYVENGKKGIEKLQQCEYDVVFCDYRMPVMDGLSVLAEVKKREFNIPVVILTGAGDDIVAANAIKLGAIEYLRKRDLPRIDFAALLDRAVEYKRARNDQKVMEEYGRLRDQLIQDMTREMQSTLDALHRLREEMVSADKEKSAGLQQAMNRLQESGIHLEGLLEDLNNLCNVSQPAAYKPRWVSLQEVLAAGLQRKRHILEAMAIQVDYQPPPKTILVRVDMESIQVVLENLISNAVHFTPDGSSISVLTERFSSGMVRVGVHNPGQTLAIGAFVRLLDNTKPYPHIPADSGQGLGLGLRICKKIVESHGGQLWLETDSLGATSYITLPTVSKH